MRILVTGGCGYKGHVLVPKLIHRGYEVIVVDTNWFGNFLKPHPKLTILEADIRHVDKLGLNDVGIVIHLASVANDPCGDLNSKLTWEINALATMSVAELAKKIGVEQFIHASSGSVYGINNNPKITENMPLNPISDYNKTKMISERTLLSYTDYFNLHILRPATVCGLSPRMRFDVAVNLLTIQALTNGEIKVLGGKQSRPNVHIEDITNAYLHFIDNPEQCGIFNIGFENITIYEIACMIAKEIPSKILVEESSDPRSYRVDSSKILSCGFLPRKTVRDAILEIKTAFERGEIENKDHFNNLKWMKKRRLAELTT